MSEIQNVVSSNISGAGYDPEARVLTVIFKSGAGHRYPDFPADKWAEFSATFDGTNGSAGKYFHANIRHLPNERIED
ncbi:MAG: KTSC domain-containing protein [Acidobacteria bacterium]|nr:KTSC domain-containing protein [Acidobacteriota bacterium]